ncbi:hypothetical protein PIIN_00571 [Serendipita indica DSM 11827]|uniref:Transmembrane protein n=1 Tax=Serendipita indica (strain DSM 11827) TaxID=1109443 RepID=G4T663_SERID|nr:hypothetical protein PIIN_00571 [Serendipita indica DSM 11827]
MSPSIVQLPFINVLVPVRLTFSFGVLVVSIKANVDKTLDGREWESMLSHNVLLACGICNLVCAFVSLFLAYIRDEKQLPPQTRWECALCGLITRLVLLPLCITTTVLVALEATNFSGVELAWAEYTLALLSVTLIVGLCRKIHAMREANVAGEQEVQRILKNMRRLSSCTTAVSTPQVLPHIIRNSPEGDIESLYLAEPLGNEKAPTVSTLTFEDSRGGE